MSKLIVGPEVALQFFEMANPTWEQFEANKLGELVVAGYTFRMRVGLHLQRPVQAIIGASQFIKIRSAGNCEGMRLKVLDPDDPSVCLYSGYWHPYGSLPQKPKASKYDSLIMDWAPYVNRITRKR